MPPPERKPAPQRARLSKRDPWEDLALIRPPEGAEDAFFPNAFTPDDVFALQALARGEASAHQQKRALRYIVTTVARSYETDFDPGPTTQAFMVGRHWVGNQVLKLLNLNPKPLRRDQAPTEQGT